MLTSLSIENYALIDSLTIDFNAGFSIITGETGAGKSIILGALSLILGQRADVKHIKQGETKCTIEGIFGISSYDLKPVFDRFDWEYDAQSCILRREIWASGKSRAFVNDSPVYLNDLKVLGDYLIDIHSQHQNLSLGDNAFQLMVVDVLAKSQKQLATYKEAYATYTQTQKALAERQAQHQRLREEEDFLRFQYTALDDANLQEGENELLETEQAALTHAEDIKSGLFGVTSCLSEGDANVEGLLRQAIDAIANVERVYPHVQPLAQRLEEAYIEVKDIRQEVVHLFDDVEVNPQRLQVVEERLSLLFDLQKKHGAPDVEALIELRDEMAQKLKSIETDDEQIAVLEKALQQAQQTLLHEAAKLSAMRQKIIPTLQTQLVEKLTYLGMPNARFECRITPKKQPDASGADEVAFLFSANKNAPLQAIGDIASGGEISRVMLCLKALIAGATALPTIIFDEIDTGTSGEVADKMGAIMQQMGERMQVIGITHLPQIASKGATHYVVYKKDDHDATHTYMRQLSADERVTELARMLSGSAVTDQAIANAKVMLGK